MDSRSGKCLAELRVSEHLNEFLFAQLSELFLGSEECKDEMFLACRSFHARSHCLEKLKELDGDEQLLFGIDSRGINRHVNFLADEFADGNELDSEASMYVDEKLRVRSVFNGLAMQNVLKAEPGFLCLCLATMSFGEHVKVGCQGKVVRLPSTVAGKLAESTAVGSAEEQNGRNPYWQKVYPSSEDFAAVNNFGRWPVVHFNAGKLDVESFLTVVPEVTSVEDNYGTVICSLVQVRLILSYGVTIHRAQGLTLDCMNCNVDGLFARGQLLVGLSRARGF